MYRLPYLSLSWSEEQAPSPSRVIKGALSSLTAAPTMVYSNGDDAEHAVQQQQPAPLSRATENGAGPLLAATLLSNESNKNGQQALKAAARSSPGIAGGGSGNGNNPKRRLRPMELKQQQRQQREQRKRAKLSLPSAAAAAAAAAVPQKLPGAGFTRSPDPAKNAPAVASPTGFRDSRGAAAAACSGSTRPLSLSGGRPRKEPLTRSASSPPSISCARG